MTKTHDKTNGPNHRDSTAQPVLPPVAKRVPHNYDLHGDHYNDEYFWMRDRQDPDLMPFLEGENRYADAQMQDTLALQTALYNEMRASIKEADETVPAREGRFVYFERTEEGKQYKKICRRKLKAGASEEVILDVDALAQGLKFLDLGATAISPSGNFMAYTVDAKGFRQYTLSVKNLRTGKTVVDIAERVTSIAWARDNKTLFYTTEDETTKRSNRLYRHKLGQKTHHLIFEETDELFELDVEGSRSGKFIFSGSSSFKTSEWRYIHSDQPKSAFTTVIAREQDVHYSVEDDGENFFILTNKNAQNYRLVKAPYATPGEEHWQELIAHREAVLLSAIDVFAGHLVVFEKENGLTKVRIQDHGSDEARYVSFSEPVFEVEATAGGNEEFEATHLRLSYESLVTPPSTFDCDLATGALTVRKVQEVPGYDPSLYRCERIFATADDGTQVPMSVVYKGDLTLDGSRPLHLYGYGAYGWGLPTTFRSTRLTVLNRGVVYVIAHIRGGNEMGEQWREQGHMRQKMNTFTDFIACGKHLIAKGYTSSDRVVIEGRSAGGLLMGAVLNLSGLLFTGAIVGVPFVDVLNTMLDETLPLTVGEFEEWGNPKDEGDYRCMKAYSPYDNLSARDYPAMLVKSAFYDSQVMYWEPAKYVAKLRSLKTDANPLLFKILLGAGGHTGMSGRFDYLLELAFDQAFLLKTVGIDK